VARNLPGLKDVKLGLALLAVRDPRASITVNENADPSVRTDMDVCTQVMYQEEHRLFMCGGVRYTDTCFSS
jgi:thiamine phosphate synthase YjbQ (UPF0047 family)